MAAPCRPVQLLLLLVISVLGLSPAAARSGVIPAPTAAPPAAAVSDEQRQVRQQSLAAVRADPDGWIRRYLQRITRRCNAQGVVIRAGTPDLAEAMRRAPLLISVEEARELFPAFARDRPSRSRHWGSVQEAALLLTDLLWQRALAQPLQPGRNQVLLSGGGIAAGRTPALAGSPALRALIARSAIVQDGSMSDEGRAVARIDQALARGRSVQVLHVFTPIEQAVRWLVALGEREGRSPASSVVARSHWQSQATVLALADRYRDQPAVRFGLLINDPGADGRLRPIEALRPLRAAADPRFPDLVSFQSHVDTLVRQALRAPHRDGDPADPPPPKQSERARPPGD